MATKSTTLTTLTCDECGRDSTDPEAKAIGSTWIKNAPGVAVRITITGHPPGDYIRETSVPADLCWPCLQTRLVGMSLINSPGWGASPASPGSPR